MQLTGALQVVGWGVGGWMCVWLWYYSLILLSQHSRYHSHLIFVWTGLPSVIYIKAYILPAGTTHPNIPYVIVGDEAFPLKLNMLRPYPGKNLSEAEAIFNYRLSRACRIIENSFGILAARWYLFRRPIIANPNGVVTYTKATIALHNYLRTTESSVYSPPGFVDGEDGVGNMMEGSWRNDEDPSQD